MKSPSKMLHIFAICTSFFHYSFNVYILHFHDMKSENFEAFRWNIFHLAEPLYFGRVYMALPHHHHCGAKRNIFFFARKPWISHKKC